MGLHRCALVIYLVLCGQRQGNKMGVRPVCVTWTRVQMSRRGEVGGWDVWFCLCVSCNYLWLINAAVDSMARILDTLLLIAKKHTLGPWKSFRRNMLTIGVFFPLLALQFSCTRARTHTHTEEEKTWCSLATKQTPHQSHSPSTQAYHADRLKSFLVDCPPPPPTPSFPIHPPPPLSALFSLPLSFSVPLSPSLSVPLSVCLSVCLSVSLSLSLSQFLSLSLSLSCARARACPTSSRHSPPASQERQQEMSITLRKWLPEHVDSILQLLWLENCATTTQLFSPGGCWHFCVLNKISKQSRCSQ